MEYHRTQSRCPFPSTQIILRFCSADAWCAFVDYQRDLWEYDVPYVLWSVCILGNHGFYSPVSPLRWVLLVYGAVCSICMPNALNKRLLNWVSLSYTNVLGFSK